MDELTRQFRHAIWGRMPPLSDIYGSYDDLTDEEIKPRLDAELQTSVFKVRARIATLLSGASRDYR